MAIPSWSLPRMVMVAMLPFEMLVFPEWEELLPHFSLKRIPNRVAFPPSTGEVIVIVNVIVML